MTTNTIMVIHERANGVFYNGKFYPYKTSLVDVPSKRNLRYYVKSILITVVSEGITAWGVSHVQGYQDSELRYLAYVQVPALTQATDYVSIVGTFSPCILLDIGSAIDYTAMGSHCAVVIVYAEIDDV